MTSPAKGRSETRSKIIAVAARLLLEHGQAAVTTRGVAAEAGVQAPTIYRLFGDKEGLLDAVAEHVMTSVASAKALDVAAASASNVDPLDDLHAGWQRQIDFGVAHPALVALLSEPDRARRSPGAELGKQVLESRVHRVAVAARLRVSERRAVDLIQAAGVGTVLTILSTPPEQRDPAFAESMYEAVLRQILTDATLPADSGTMATAVALRAIAPRLGMLSESERQLLAEWLDRVIQEPEPPGARTREGDARAPDSGRRSSSERS